MQSTCRASIAPSSRGMSSEKKRRKAQWAHHQHISIISIASYRIALSFDLRTLPYILHLLRAFTHEYRNPPLNGGFPIRCGLCEHSPGISLWMVPSGSLLWMPMWEQACSTIIVEDRVIRRHTVDDSLARGKSQALALPCYPWLSCKTRC